MHSNYLISPRLTPFTVALACPIAYSKPRIIGGTVYHTSFIFNPSHIENSHVPSERTNARDAQFFLTMGDSMIAFCASLTPSLVLSPSEFLLRQCAMARKARELRCCSILFSLEAVVSMANAASLAPCCNVRDARRHLSSGLEGSATTAFCATETACVASPYDRSDKLIEQLAVSS